MTTLLGHQMQATPLSGQKTPWADCPRLKSLLEGADNETQSALFLAGKGAEIASIQLLCVVSRRCFQTPLPRAIRRMFFPFDQVKEELVSRAPLAR